MQYKDITVRRGETFTMKLTVADGIAPVDLQSATIKAHIKRNSTDQAKLAEFVIDRDSLQSGVIGLSLPSKATDLLIMQKPVEVYCYDVRVEIGGNVQYLVGGKFTLICNVTGGAL